MTRRFRAALGQPTGFQPGIFGLPGRPDIAAGVPGPSSPMHPTPTMPASLFPTNVKWGDVVTVQGPFAGKFQGQVLVRFAGVPAQAVALTSQFGGSVVVPEGAESGACQIEVDGRVVHGTNCVVSRGMSGPMPPARAPEHRGVRAWKNVGEGTALLGDDMTYFEDQYEGVGAIAADGRAPRSAPAPSFGRGLRDGGRMPDVPDGLPREITERPRLTRKLGRPRRVYPGVKVQRQALTRRAVVVSGRKPGLPPRAGARKRPIAPPVMRPVTSPIPGYRPAVPPSPISRPPAPIGPASQIGSGIGTPTQATVRTIAMPVGAPKRRPEPEDRDLAKLRAELGPPPFEAEPTPEEIDEAKRQLDAKKARRTTLLVALGGAAIGLYALTRKK